MLVGICSSVVLDECFQMVRQARVRPFGCTCASVYKRLIVTWPVHMPLCMCLPQHRPARYGEVTAEPPCAVGCRPPPLRWRATRPPPTTAPTARGGSTRAGRASRTSAGGTCSATGRTSGGSSRAPSRRRGMAVTGTSRRRRAPSLPGRSDGSARMAKAGGSRAQ